MKKKKGNFGAIFVLASVSLVFLMLNHIDKGHESHQRSNEEDFQRERILRLREKCEEGMKKKKIKDFFPNEETPELNKKNGLNFFVSDPSRKLFYCQIPKVTLPYVDEEAKKSILLCIFSPDMKKAVK